MVTSSGETDPKHGTAASLVRHAWRYQAQDSKKITPRRSRHDDVCSHVPQVRCSDAVNRRERPSRRERIDKTTLMGTHPIAALYAGPRQLHRVTLSLWSVRLLRTKLTDRISQASRQTKLRCAFCSAFEPNLLTLVFPRDNPCATLHVCPVRLWCWTRQLF